MDRQGCMGGGETSVRCREFALWKMGGLVRGQVGVREQTAGVVLELCSRGVGGGGRIVLSAFPRHLR